MPDPNPNPIVWSAAANQFYQKGRVGAVPYLEAVESLRISQPGTQLRYYDQVGNRVPNPENLLWNRMVDVYAGINKTTRSVPLSDLARSPGDGKYYTSWFIYRDLDNVAKLGYNNWRINKKGDDELMTTRAVKNIYEALKLDELDQVPTSPQVTEFITTFFLTVSSDK